MRNDARVGEPIRVAFRTLGCKVNRVESDTIAAELLGAGVVVSSEAEAEVVVVNTCTVTGEADAKARKAVRHALGATRQPLVVVTGCLAAVDADVLRALDPRVIVEADKAQVALRVTTALGLGSKSVMGRSHVDLAPAVRYGADFRTRASLKIQDGCDNFCTYCIVPFARGLPVAVPLEMVVAQTRELVDAGVNEIVLTGINVGRYRDSGVGLATLIRAVAGEGIARLRLSSIEPPDLTPQLLSALSETSAVCEHLHVPLQSGNDAVLKAMGRTYDTTRFAELIAAARESIPGLAITTDIIAGFPGETDEDHTDTLAFVEQCQFARLHVFRYSAREGTPAAAMAQIDPRVRAQRASDLRALGERLHERYAASRVGAVTELLVEQVSDGIVRGTTRDYLRLSVEGASAPVGTLLSVEVTSAATAVASTVVEST